ncbi:MAG: DUF2935 domain-containing protein [Dehalobacterium sp.]
MYCYIYAQSINCILNELLLWSEISREHPVFIKTVAELTNKNLPQNLLKELAEINEIFSALKEKVEVLHQEMVNNPYFYYAYTGKIRELVETFLMYDQRFLEVLPEIMQYGKDDPVWQELLEHINKEQSFMYQLFYNLLGQI